jgi:hypothetical protein
MIETLQAIHDFKAMKDLYSIEEQNQIIKQFRSELKVKGSRPSPWDLELSAI